MNINQKQYNLLIKVLNNYNLKKEISVLTPFEAYIIIEGILNNGKVKDTYKDNKLSDAEVNRRQKCFDDLVSIKNPYASDKQLIYIQNLCKTTKYELNNEKIKREHVNDIISFLRDKVDSKIAFNYLKEIKEDDLIKVKKNEEDSNTNIPEEWILYNVDINGIIDF